MSKNVVDAVIEFTEETDNKIGFIPSRRQVEYNGGYVNNWQTGVFAEYVRSRTSLVILQRDHGGRAQGSRPEAASYNSDAIEGKFDLIHIDPWKEFVSLDEMVTETADNIRLCNAANNKCQYEVGTEEAIHRYTAEELDYFLTLLKINDFFFFHF